MFAAIIASTADAKLQQRMMSGRGCHDGLPKALVKRPAYRRRFRPPSTYRPTYAKPKPGTTRLVPAAAQAFLLSGITKPSPPAFLRRPFLMQPDVMTATTDKT